MTVLPQPLSPMMQKRLASVDLQVDVAQDHLLAEPHRHAFELDDRPGFGVSVEGRDVGRSSVAHRRPDVLGQMA